MVKTVRIPIPRGSKPPPNVPDENGQFNLF